MVDYITDMSPRHVVVDGSNIATEGRSLPSLAQLDQAVREFLAENPDDIVTVVVDASFGHRIEPSELRTFEEAEAAAEVVSPPAGAIGRGDAFLLRIAEKTGATVLSNDSFQEFHGEHEWLFDNGRLIGGKPVPGVGWIFTPRTPVRGPKSREAVKEAKRRRRSTEVVDGASGLDLAASRGKGRGRKVEKAIATATDEVTGSADGSRRRRRRTSEPPSEPVNLPLTFINFIAAHRLGSTVDGTVDAFSSHGAFVTVDGATCYLPLSAMGEPPPNRAREVVSKGEQRTFVVQAFDPLRRGIELAVPGFEHIAAGVTDETVEAEIAPLPEEEEVATAARTPGRRSRRRGAPGVEVPTAAASFTEGQLPVAPAAPVPLPELPADLPPAVAQHGTVAPARRRSRAGAETVPAPAAAGPPEPQFPDSIDQPPAPAKQARPRKAATGRKAASTEAAVGAGSAAPATPGAPGETGSGAKAPAAKAPAAKASAKKVASSGKAPATRLEDSHQSPPAAKSAAAAKATAKKAGPESKGAPAGRTAPAGKPAATQKVAATGTSPAQSRPAKAAPKKAPAGKAAPAKAAAPAGKAATKAPSVTLASAAKRRAVSPQEAEPSRGSATRRSAAAAREGAGTATGRTDGGGGRGPRRSPSRQAEE
ncbi:MAG: NYN domain-containing protein [Acidimicrobiales bacterium]